MGLHMTPTVLRAGPYRFFFYSGDRLEPPRVHMERDTRRAKFWLSPVRLEHDGGVGQHELKRLTALVADNHTRLLDAWHEFFSD